MADGRRPKLSVRRNRTYPLERHGRCDGILILTALIRHADDAARVGPNRVRAVRARSQAVVIPDERAAEADVGISRAGAHQELLAKRRARHGSREIRSEQPVPRRIIALLELDLDDAVVGDGDPRIHLVGGREIAVYDGRAAPRRAAIRRSAEPHVRVTGAIISPDDVHRAIRAYGDRRE